MSETYPRNVEFESIREIWNRYECENDVILRNKITLKRLTAVSKINNQVAYNSEFNLSTETNIPPKIESGQVHSSMVSLNTTQIKIPEDIEKELKFKVLVNKPQIYETEEGNFIFIAEIMNNIWLTKKIDQFGRPVYHANTTAEVSMFISRKK